MTTGRPFKVPEMALRVCVIPLAVASLWQMATNRQADDTYGAISFSNLAGFNCLLRGLHLAVISQVPRSLRLAGLRPGSGGRVPAADVVLGGGGGGVPGAGGRPAGVVGRGVLLLRPLLWQGHRVRGAAGRRAALLRRALTRLSVQGLQQVRRPRL